MFIQIIHGVKDLILWTVTQPHVGLLLWEFFFSMEWIIVETRVVVGFETLPTSSTLCHVTLWPLSLKRQCVSLLLESGLEWGTDLAGKKIATPHKQKLEWLAWFHSFPWLVLLPQAMRTGLGQPAGLSHLRHPAKASQLLEVWGTPAELADWPSQTAKRNTGYPYVSQRFVVIHHAEILW